MCENYGTIEERIEADLAQVHHIRAAVDDEIAEVDEPLFVGYRYVWNSNGITIRFCGSNYYFHIFSDFPRYISPACAQYSLFTNFGLTYIHSLPHRDQL